MMIEVGQRSQQVLRHVHFKVGSRLPKECKAFSQTRIAAMVQCVTRRLSGGALSHLAFSADNLRASPADSRTLRKVQAESAALWLADAKALPCAQLPPNQCKIETSRALAGP